MEAREEEVSAPGTLPSGICLSIDECQALLDVISLLLAGYGKDKTIYNFLLTAEQQTVVRKIYSVVTE
jgi:hypothetical protein